MLLPHYVDVSTIVAMILWPFSLYELGHSLRSVCTVRMKNVMAVDPDRSRLLATFSYAIPWKEKRKMIRSSRLGNISLSLLLIFVVVAF